MTEGGMTIEAFIAWSLALPDPRRWELHDGHPVQRPGSWGADGLIKTEVLAQLMGALEHGASHEVLGFGPLVIVDEHTAVEPHFVITPRAGVDPDDVVLGEPLGIVEVIRADGRAEHWGPRLLAYVQLPSVRHVVGVHAAARTALHLRRTGPGAVTAHILRGGVVALDPPGVALDLDRVWGRLDRRRGGGGSR